MTEAEVLSFIREGGLVRGLVRPYRTSYFVGNGRRDAINVTRQVNSLTRKGKVQIDKFAITPGYHRVVAA